MISYESVFALPASMPEEERKSCIEEAEKAITSSKGKLIESEDMGEKQMAYIVKGHKRAYYHLIRFDAPPEAFKSINDYFRYNDSYIRSLTVKREEAKKEA
ncbi:MAG: 30S ribosomal protein S6 [Elusimicrobiota bacterium]